ncbi:MAG: zinc-binding alcohol dehydrogenase family protein [Hyphomicrobiales bacterium]|nr:zinc-binding alcohol dehydrogenase family protein [Hyphomicrobiales bacterium]
MRTGEGSLAVNFPHVPGKDFTGVVATVGSDCREFQVGRRVCGVARLHRTAPMPSRLPSRRKRSLSCLIRSLLSKARIARPIEGARLYWRSCDEWGRSFYFPAGCRFLSRHA